MKTLQDKKKFDWWSTNVTSEIYLNTERYDWWRASEKIAELIKGARSVIDIGGGDAHTLWQILSLVLERTKNLREVVFVEPSPSGLRLAKRRLNTLNIKNLKLIQGTLENSGQKLLQSHATFDVLYAGHANYYFGKQTGGNYNPYKYTEALEILPKLAKTVIIMTAPKQSDYHSVVAKNPFHDRVFSEWVTDFYKSKGHQVEVIDTPMRFFVAHAAKSVQEAIVLWKFFNDTERKPTTKELGWFKNRLVKVQDKDGYIDFKDQLVVVRRQ